ncbi:MAG TPA: radical SAM family heme chaperone HemW [Abditibacteriaceae bacterium]|jgi:oxygen-independent coproporphyrinogen-3 oxidase
MFGLYVHIPFCARLCPYCDFAVSANAKDDFVADYLAALRLELQNTLRDSRSRERLSREPRPLTSIFFGGGTPTYLAPAVLNELLQLIRDEHPVAPDAEISFEANPENLCRSDYSLSQMRAAGWNRVSLGAQSFDDNALQRIGRRHTSTQVETAFANARAAGFDNISLDLMFALPGQSRESWRETLQQAIILAPEHLSCYALTIEGNTLFARHVARGQLIPVEDDLQAELMQDAFDLTRAAGLERYEVSNYAHPGFECRHNMNYWRGGDYLAVGCGAHGHRQGHRWWNERSAKKYVQLMQQRGSARDDEEKLSSPQRLSELVMLGLRLRDGFNLDAISQQLEVDARQMLNGELVDLTRNGVLLDSHGTITLAPAAVPLADAVALRLLAESPSDLSI